MHFICLSVGSLYGFAGGYLRFCPEISPPVGFMPQLIPPTGRYLMTVVYRKHSKKYTLHALRLDCNFAPAYQSNRIAMNRTEFEELEKQVQQSGLSLKSYLRQIGVSYSTYHYWQKKYSAEQDSIKPELAPINIKRPTAELSLDEQAPYDVALLVPNGLSANFGSGPEKLLREVLNKSLQVGQV